MARATSKTGYGSGWHFQTKRHSNARRTGRAGGKYANGIALAKEFEQTIEMAELKALSKTSLEQPLTTQQTQRMLELGKKYITTPQEKIIGGLGDNKPDQAFNPKSLAKGIRVEMEHTNDPYTAKEIAKDHLTEDKEYYTKLEQIEKPQNQTLTIPPPPLKTSNSLPIQISTIVPSTTNTKNKKGETKSKKVPAREFARRVNETKKYFDKKFGGDTAITEIGSYYDGKNLIKEKGAIVESSTTIPKYKKTIKNVARFIEKKRRTFGNQDTMLLTIEGRKFITPQKKYIDDDKKTKNTNIPVT